MNRKRIDVEGILNTLASVRQQLPQLPPTPAHKPERAAALPGTFVAADDDAMETFEMTVLADALQSFAGEVSASIEASERKLMADAMKIYYAAAELSKEPEHAHLIPSVENMRAIYLRDFGREIPEKG